jgi:hypothetical protein
MPGAGRVEVNLSKLGQFDVPEYELALQIMQEGRQTFSFFVLLEIHDLLLARYTLVFVHK